MHDVAIAPKYIRRLGKFPVLVISLWIIGISIAGCIKPPTSESQKIAVADKTSISTTIVTPTSTLTPTLTLRVTHGNVRSGPGLNYPLITTIGSGDVYQIVGKSEDSAWWQICCFPQLTDKTGKTLTIGWISASIVSTRGDTSQIKGKAEQIWQVNPLFSSDFEAKWLINYRCDSSRCTVKECNGSVEAYVRDVINQIWLEVDRKVHWLDSCGEDTLALYQINRYTGQDRYINDNAAFFDRYWVGSQPGVATTIIKLADGQHVDAWCKDSQTAERQEPGGWITIYDGQACYDLKTGMLLTMSYAKRWLYTGSIEGKKYERAFFGDTEYYKLQIESSNAALSKHTSSR